MRRKKEVRRSRSAPDRRKKREGASQCTLGQSRPSDLATNPETGRTAAMYQVNPDHGASSSMSHGNQDWTDAWESAEEWNRWHLQYAAAWMRQNYTPPANLPMVSPPTPKYGGKKGQRKGKGGKPTQGKKEENQDTLTSGLGENVKKALEMWRIMENPAIRGLSAMWGISMGEMRRNLHAKVNPPWGKRQVPRVSGRRKARCGLLGDYMADPASAFSIGGMIYMKNPRLSIKRCGAKFRRSGRRQVR